MKAIQLRNFQREVVNKLKSFTTPGVYNACEQGLGKTVMSIIYAEEMGFKEVLVLCPAILVWNWEEEIKKFAENPNIWCVYSYDKARYRGDSFLEGVGKKFDLLICDEAHKLKSPHAQTTHFVLNHLNSKIPYKCFLSGTPMGNTAGDLWTTFSRCLIDYKHFASYDAFVDRYAHIQKNAYGVTVVGGKRVKELSRVAKDNFFIRRTKEQAAPELPPKIRTTIPVKCDWSPEGDYKEFLKEYEKLLDKSGESIPETSQWLSRQMRQLGAAKAMGAVEFTSGLAEVGKVIVIFAYHTCVLDILERELGKKYAVARVCGAQPDHVRTKNIEWFCKGREEDGPAQILVAQITAAGVGLNLVRSSTLIFAESSWSLIAMKQCEDRVHRIGQEADIVDIYSVVGKGTVDEKLWAVLGRKLRLFNKTIEE